MNRKFTFTSESWIFCGLLLLCAGVYTFNITYSDMWTDEAWSKALVGHSFPEMFSLLADDFHPPLYFVLLKLFTSLVGSSVFTVRLFSVIGTLCTLALSYHVGQRVLARKGALYFCAFLMSIPMLAVYSRTGRMYTWGAFFVTGIFFYACLYIQHTRKKDLVFLALFTCLAAYTHYYTLIAAFWANVFVFVTLLLQRKKAWKVHLVTMLCVAGLYLPWMFALSGQVHDAQGDYWIAPVSLGVVRACYHGLFAVKYLYFKASYVMVWMVLVLTLASLCQMMPRWRDRWKVPLGLSLLLFHGTLLTGVVLSFAIKPILIGRYLLPAAGMLMIPPAIFLSDGCSFQRIRAAAVMLFLGCGVGITLMGSYLSEGPFKQTAQYLSTAHPEIHKIVHVTETTVGPLMEFRQLGVWDHYWIQSDESVSYTNLDVFGMLRSVGSVGQVAEGDETFCLVDVKGASINRDFLAHVLSECDVVQVDEVEDQKIKGSGVLLLYILRYHHDTIQAQL